MVLKYLGVIEAPSPRVRYLMYCGILFSVLMLSLKSMFALSTLGLEHYGYMLHGNTPWFNFRATQYMSDHGWDAFTHWFDDKSWYPLGRPVGSTTYPGLQITAVALHRGLNYLGFDMPLNNVCVMLPMWVGLVGLAAVGALAYELSGSLASATAAIMVLGAVPAHAIPALVGEFDPTGLAATLMTVSFYFWVRALRCPKSWPMGALAGLAYGYMASVWAGHVFALNVIALHAAICAAADFFKNRHNPALLRAYALFYVIGTAIATRVPPVGMAPFKSLEQLSALLVLLFLIALQTAEFMCVGCAGHVAVPATDPSSAPAVTSATAEKPGADKTKKKKNKKEETETIAATATAGEVTENAESEKPPRKRILSLRTSVVCCLFLALCMVMQAAMSVGLLNAPSPQLRAILPGILGGRSFADSAEDSGHIRSPLRVQRDRGFSGSIEVIWGGIYTPYFLWLSYMMVSTMQLLSRLEKPPQVFAPLLCAASLFLGMRVRLGMPLVAVGASLAAGLAGGWAFDLAVKTAFWEPDTLAEEAAKVAADRAAYEAELETVPKRQRNTIRHLRPRFDLDMRQMKAENPYVAVLVLSGPLIVILVSFFLTGFRDGAMETVFPYVHPGITFHTVEDDDLVRVDDYYDGYTWLNDNTPTDARVLAWHPHGFHINAVANRTTLVDGNTWNDEQLALVAKMLVSPVTEAHDLMRHVADYVLIWAGNEGPLDIYQAPLMALTANALFKDVCPGDSLCRFFSFTDDEMIRPRPMLKQSLIYTLHQHNIDKRKPIRVDPELFEEVYMSPRGLVRIYRILNVSEESKQWMADPAHHTCGVASDAWICPGQYPPTEPFQSLRKLAESGFDIVGEEDLPQTFPKTAEEEE